MNGFTGGTINDHDRTDIDFYFRPLSAPFVVEMKSDYDFMCNVFVFLFHLTLYAICNDSMCAIKYNVGSFARNSGPYRAHLFVHDSNRISCTACARIVLILL